MDGRKYYVLCQSNCKFESMTKEQILTAIEQAVSTGKIIDVDSGFITKIKEQNGGRELQMWVGTQAEYNAIKEKKESCFYIITDDTTAEDYEKALELQNETIKEIDGRVLKNSVNITKNRTYINNAASTAAYLAFVGDVNQDMVDAAFGKGNEENAEGIGNALAMYGWNKGIDKKQYPFAELQKMNKLNDFNHEIYDEIIINDILSDFIHKSEYATNKIYEVKKAALKFENAGAQIKETSLPITVRENDLNGYFRLTFSATAANCHGTGRMNVTAQLNSITMNVIENIYNTTKIGVENGLFKWSDFGITTAGTYNLSIILTYEYAKSETTLEANAIIHKAKN